LFDAPVRRAVLRSVAPTAIVAAIQTAIVAAIQTAIVAAIGMLSATVRAEDPVAVLVTGPLSANVGDRVAFEVELVNRSGRPLEKLRVVDYFDKGFHHEASASPIEQKGTIDLAAGTSRRLTLDFLLDEPGRQCHRVEILDQSHTFVGGATSCVQVAGLPLAAAAPQSAPVAAQPIPNAYPATTYPASPPTPATPAPLAAPLAAASPAAATPLPAAIPPSTFGAPAASIPPPTSSLPASAALPATPSLELDLVGPAEVLAGSVSEYVATVRNTGSVASGATALEFGWDDAFTPLEASEGYKLAASRVTWSLPSIEPGGQLRRQINLRSQPGGAVSPTSRSCVRGVLSGSVGGVMVADESCVFIRSSTPPPRARTPREAGLRLTLADCDDPVVVGHPTMLICTVVNSGGQSSGRLDLTVVLPERATLVGDPSPSRVRIDGSTVTFDAIPSIAPGGQATVELAYRIPGSGVAKATALLTGTELEGSIDSSCQTTFLAP